MSHIGSFETIGRRLSRLRAAQARTLSDSARGIAGLIDMEAERRTLRDENLAPLFARLRAATPTSARDAPFRPPSTTIEPFGRFSDELRAGRPVPEPLELRGRTFTTGEVTTPAERLALSAPPGAAEVEATLRERGGSPLIGPALQAAERFEERFVRPSASLIGQTLRQRQTGRVRPTGVTEAGIVQPSPEQLGERGFVNPLRAALGSDKEIAKSNEVFRELGISGLALELLIDPLNFVPIVGFTKFDDFARLVKGASRLTGKARTQAVNRLRQSPVVQDALRGVREAPEAGARPLGGEGVPPRGPEPPREPPPTALGAEPPETVGNRFVAPLREFEDVASEVVARDDLTGKAIARLGINPSLAENTEVGRILTAYERQRIATGELVDVAVASSLDVHAQPFTGRTGGVFSIGSDARIKRLPTKPGQSDVWMDVFSRPGEYPLKPAQRALVDDYVQVVRELEEMRLAAGLKPRGINREGWFYIPRQAKGARGVEFRRPSDPGLQRVFEEAQEGVAKGVPYDSDFRAVLELHARNAYREVLEKQLSDALTPLSVKPSELLRATKPTLVANMETASQRLVNANRNIRRLRVPQEVTGSTGRAARTGLKAQRQAAQQELASAQSEFNRLKQPYRRAVEAARKSEIGPGNLFGKAEENIAIATWRNRFFPREDADLLRESLASFGVSAKSANWIGRSFELLGNHIRFLSAIGDFAAPFIQGQPILARSPAVWAKATLRHYQAFVDPTVQARLIREHLPTYQKLAQNGVPIGDPEFFAVLRRGGGLTGFSPARLLEQTPKGAEVRRLLQAGGRQTFGRFQASYNTFLGTSRALLVEGMENSWRGADGDMFAFIRNLSGGLDSRALGVGPTQRGVEGTWLAFSPRLLRSTVSLVADMRLGPLHPRGRAAMTTVGRYFAGVTGLYVASGLALGKSWKEIETGLNPLEGRKFLSHEINGDWVGVGGQFRALAQIVAYTGRAAATGDVDAFTSANVLENPLLRAWSFRGAPGINVGGGLVEFLTGGDADVLPFDDVDNLPSLLRHLGTSALPFSVQGKLEGGQWTSVPFELAGGRTLPLFLKDAFEQKTGRDWNETPSALRREIINADPDLKAIQARQRQTDLGEAATRIRTDRSAALLPHAQAVLSGADPLTAARAYNDNRRFIMAEFGGASGEAFRELDIEPKGKDNELLNQYYDVDFRADHNRNGIPGDDEDVKIALETQDKFKAGMSPDVQRALDNPANFFTDPTVIEVETIRKRAVGAIRQITKLPKWQGLTFEQGEKLDELVSQITADVQRFKAQAVREGLDPEIVNFRSTAQWLADQGSITELDAENAIAVSSRKAIRAQERIDLALAHRDDLLKLFPDFFDSVLPVEVEREELSAEEIERFQPAGVR